MRKFGEYVNSLGGKYITAEDVGMSASDMVQVKKQILLRAYQLIWVVEEIRRQLLYMAFIWE